MAHRTEHGITFFDFETISEAQAAMEQEHWEEDPEYDALYFPPGEPENDDIAGILPDGWRWATAEEAEVWDTLPRRIQVLRGFDGTSPMTDIAVPDEDADVMPCGCLEGMHYCE